MSGLFQDCCELSDKLLALALSNNVIFDEEEEISELQEQQQLTICAGSVFVQSYLEQGRYYEITPIYILIRNLNFGSGYQKNRIKKHDAE